MKTTIGELLCDAMYAKGLDPTDIRDQQRVSLMVEGISFFTLARILEDKTQSPNIFYVIDLMKALDIPAERIFNLVPVGGKIKERGKNGGRPKKVRV